MAFDVEKVTWILEPLGLDDPSEAAQIHGGRLWGILKAYYVAWTNTQGTAIATERQKHYERLTRAAEDCLRLLRKSTTRGTSIGRELLLAAFRDFTEKEYHEGPDIVLLNEHKAETDCEEPRLPNPEEATETVRRFVAARKELALIESKLECLLACSKSVQESAQIPNPRDPETKPRKKEADLLLMEELAQFFYETTGTPPTAYNHRTDDLPTPFEAFLQRFVEATVAHIPRARIKISYVRDNLAKVRERLGIPDPRKQIRPGR